MAQEFEILPCDKQEPFIPVELMCLYTAIVVKPVTEIPLL